jgi:hypothetical protein
VSDINWNVEFRKITRELDGLPPERTRTQVRLERIQQIVAKDRFNDRLVVIGIWARLILIAALALSLFWWPYGRSCGFPLAAYLMSNAVVIVGGVALAVRGWRDHMVPVFVGSALCMAIAWTVLALNILPRVGYSPAGPISARWTCVARR